MKNCEIRKYREALADHFDLKLYDNRMYGKQPFADLYNFLADLHVSELIQEKP